jgi:hypothetical protein
MTNALNDLRRDGVRVTLGLAARLSPYLKEHIKRFEHYILDMETLPEPLQPKPLFVTTPSRLPEDTMTDFYTYSR